jgi:hypothetical protein
MKGLMRPSRIVLSLAATGGVAAALFGGGVVNTAFTSTASGSISASTASIGTTLTDGTISLSNAIPGVAGPTQNITVTNQGSTPELISVKFGTGSNPTLDNLVDVNWDGNDVGTLGSLGGASGTLDDGHTLAPNGQPGDSITIPVYLELESSADDSVANSSDTISYTITGTASQATGTDGTQTWAQGTNGPNPDVDAPPTT